MGPVKSQMVAKVAMSCYFLNSGMEQWNDFFKNCSIGIAFGSANTTVQRVIPTYCGSEGGGTDSNLWSGTKTSLVWVWDQD